MRIDEEKRGTFYDQDGESTYGYTVGDEIKATMRNSKDIITGWLEGKVTEIFVSEARGIFQLKINNGWCCHPGIYYGHDSVEIIKHYE